MSKLVISIQVEFLYSLKHQHNPKSQSMGLFDLFKKKEPVSEKSVSEPLENYPKMFLSKILFIDKPIINPIAILDDLKLVFKTVDYVKTDESHLYFFPVILVEYQDGSHPSQISLSILKENSQDIEIAEEAFQQNWDWEEGNALAGKCQYQISVSDLMTRPLNYKSRTELFTAFISSIVKTTQPDVVYFLPSQKLINPRFFSDKIDVKDGKNLEGFINVRLFNITDGHSGELIMDTLGLHLLGLPDFQIRFSSFEPGLMAGLLWNCAYYLFDKGDILKSGNTIMGLGADSKWRVERQTSLLEPQRMVITVFPN